MSTALTLYIGNKNYSSWSLRPWLALKEGSVAFDEVQIPLYQPDSRAKLLLAGPTAKVPVLHHGPVRVWESLAICEYAAELFPSAHLWPLDPALRAHARSISNEMHAGFAALRTHMPMDMRARKAPKSINDQVRADIARVTSIWKECRMRFGHGGQLLFGSFTIADAMFAPVVSRFTTYGVDVDSVSKAYMDAIWALPAMRAWKEAAEKEPWTID
jgi:glutathione S-transferase